MRLHAAYALISKLARRVFSHFRDGSKHDIELLITFLMIFFLKENVQDLVAQFISDKDNEKKKLNVFLQTRKKKNKQCRRMTKNSDFFTLVANN